MSPTQEIPKDKTKEIHIVEHQSIKSSSESQDDEDNSLFQILKNHVAKIEARTNPEKLDRIKRHYEEITKFDQLLTKEIPGMKEISESPDLTVEEYVVGLFS